MQIDDDNVEMIELSALDVEALSTKVRARIQEKPMLNDNYQKLCMQVTSVATIDGGYTLYDDLLCWKNQVYVLEGMWRRVIK